MTTWLTWREATQRALYGDGGFYRRALGPADHFRTSVHASPLFAEAVLALVRATALTTVVDVGSGRGELVRTLRGLDPTLHLVAVELADRPADLPADIGWVSELPTDVDGLVVGNEWLDNVPVDAAVVTGDGWHLLLVDPATGEEQPGEPVGGADLAWLRAWWPIGEVGDRAEIGHPRDQAWATAVGALSHGLALAVDYQHGRAARPPAGSLVGYRRGTVVDAVPDGTCDITSQVALDACAAAGLVAGGAWTVLTDQRSALRALLGPQPAPAYDVAGRDPAAYLAALSRASQAAELMRADGLGGFGWLAQGVGLAAPAVLTPGEEQARPRRASDAGRG